MTGPWSPSALILKCLQLPAAEWHKYFTFPASCLHLDEFSCLSLVTFLTAVLLSSWKREKPKATFAFYLAFHFPPFPSRTDKNLPHLEACCIWLVSEEGIFVTFLQLRVTVCFALRCSALQKTLIFSRVWRIPRWQIIKNYRLGLLLGRGKFRPSMDSTCKFWWPLLWIKSSGSGGGGSPCCTLKLQLSSPSLLKRNGLLFKVLLGKSRK